MSLKRRTLKGFMWMSLDVLMIRGLAFVTSIYLAKLVGPEEFGLVGMMALFIAIGLALVDSGLSESLIRSDSLEEDDYSSVFFMNILICLLIYSLLFFTAPFIAHFYEQPRLIYLIQAYSMCLIFSGFSSVQTAILIKELRFKKLTVLNVPGSIIGSLIGVVMAYNDYGVWSIVVMYLVTQGFQSLMLWIFSKWRPILKINFTKVSYHFNFGYKLLISAILNVSFNNIYNILIGKFFPLKALGYYERASAFSNQPVSIFSGIISKVTYPMLTLIREDSKKIEEVYRKIFRTTFFITSGVMVLVVACSKPIFNLILGPEWLPAVPYFQILSIGAIFYPINVFNLNILKVFGRTDLFLRLEIIKKVFILLCVSIGFIFGIYGLLWSSVLASFGAIIINGYYSARIIDYSVRSQVLDLSPTLIVAVVLYFMLKLLNYYLVVDSDFYKILITMFFGFSIYLGISYIFKMKALSYITQLIRNRRP
ncbi:lipopolysaccharide biosynthesis protein [uncultured Croceitalea sp.]|uniref:lipopolysaccharide biosynthesis protein n=1 Tax=uncultured Croceitalea sp. TaxID=1798908 RepID=UPI00374FD52C